VYRVSPIHRAIVQVGLALLLALAGGVGLTGDLGLTEIASAEVCKNEARRVEQGSTYLPDCRAYELVTPAEKGATQALVFGGLTDTRAIPAENGERVGLSTHAFLGSNPGSHGTNAVFSRGASSWEMTSLQPTGAGEVNFAPDLFSSELTQVGIEAYSSPGAIERHSPTQTFEVGLPGGPYPSVVATTPAPEVGKAQERLVGSSSDFSHVVLSSLDGSLLPVTAGTADSGKPNLYDWVDGQLHVVNVTNEGKLVSECGAVLGYGPVIEGPDDSRAVWSEGSSSKIFFTSPYRTVFNETGGPGCTAGGEPPENAEQLYMRVNDSETVNVSAPQLEGTVPCDPGTWPVRYQGASADGSKVFFTTESELTPDHTMCHSQPDMELYEYDTVTRKLTRVSRGEPGTPLSTADANVKTEKEYPAVVSEDGSAVYFAAQHKLTEDAAEDPSEYDLYRYDTATSKIRLVAVVGEPSYGGSEYGYATPNGEFYLFPSMGVSGQLRGQGHNEMYLYDNADGKVMCVSCGSGVVAPALGQAVGPRNELNGILTPQDLTPPFIPMSENGRYVFFNSTARLVSQDSNSAEEPNGGAAPGQDVYEWEADGTGGCAEANGCTHLISSGTDEHFSVLLGISQDGSNVFFATFAQLAPQDVDTQPDIYDARIDGGFAAPAAPVRCSGESCRLIPSAPAVISTPLSATFSGVGNIVPSAPNLTAMPKSLSRGRKLAKALNACGKEPRKKRARCKAQARKRYGAKAAKSAAKGDR
jgi:hypothetical protein